MDYGKKVTQESYFEGKLKSVKTEYSVPVRVQTKAQALNEVMKCLEMIANCEAEEMTITIDTDPRTKGFKMITKKYTVVDK